MFKDGLVFDLQFFADYVENKDGDGQEADKSADDVGQEGQEKEDDENKEEVKTFTQDDLDEAVKEATKDLLSKDKVNEIVEARIAKEKAKAKMTAEEKAEEERLERERELAEAKETIRLMELNNDTSNLLDEEGLPQSFKGFLIGDDLEATKENISGFKKVFEAEVTKAVKNKLKSGAPDGGEGEVDPIQSAWDNAASKIK